MDATTLETPHVLPLPLLREFDTPGPRYTSYPTADRFIEAFTAADYASALSHRAQGGGLGGRKPLSLYVHIPFCESVCYYCACNKVITKHHERATEYLDALGREIQLTAQHLGVRPAVSQLHLGGGTPTFLSDAELSRLMGMLREAFDLVAGAEISIEVDPRTATHERLAHWRQLGFNRLSYGVQDFEPEVQKAVHRVQPFEQVQALMASARALDFESINIDLIYGLPRQTPESMARTVAQVGELRPDRIALYAYAHLPERFKPQRRIDVTQLPPPGDRLRMLDGAMTGFEALGYHYIGMDHFALPEDPLAVAKRQGRLQRNFQGYSTQPDSDLIALGVSAIGRVGATYSQNAKTLPEYYDALHQGRLPVQRGLALSRDDLLRRAVIMALMCQGRVDFEAIAEAHLVDFREHFGPELERLRSFEQRGLLSLEDGAVQVTPTGWFLVRAIAMVFDKHLQADQRRQRYSKVI